MRIKNNKLNDLGQNYFRFVLNFRENIQFSQFLRNTAGTIAGVRIPDRRKSIDSTLLNLHYSLEQCVSL